MIEWRVEPEDGGRVRLSGLGDISHILTHGDVDKLIQSLAEARATYRGPVPTTMQGLPVVVAWHPTWYVQYEAERVSSVITFFHPLFGPVGAAFPIHVVNDMQRLFSIHAFLYLEELAMKPKPREYDE